MPKDEALKRLGGGRWETRDGRFAIEPQSGTWVVVDTTQTDDLGLPLVRGPFGSLTAAKASIEEARTSGPAESPLKDRLAQAHQGGEPSRATPARAKRSSVPDGDDADEADGAADHATGDDPPTVEPAPPEPKWLFDLAPADRRRAREMLERLVELGLPDPETIARAEITRDQPAIARLALERSIVEAIGRARSPRGGAKAVLEVLARGKDDQLGARWRLVDDRGRRIDDLDVPD